MKKLAFISVLVLSIVVGFTLNGYSQDSKIAVQPESTNGPKIKFNETVHDFGNIKYGAESKYVFKFTNTGNEPLILSRPKSSCGCTIPTWPKEPILPGETNEILVTYNSHHVGAFNKTVTVYSNAINNKSVVLRIKGKVVREQSASLPENTSSKKSPVSR
jgi:hypothetical protein